MKKNNGKPDAMSFSFPVLYKSMVTVKIIGVITIVRSQTFTGYFIILVCQNNCPQNVNLWYPNQLFNKKDFRFSEN